MSTHERREREREERRQQILDAAEDVFFAHGPSATMEQVADAAEIGKGTLYLYFQSREELLFSVSSRVLAQLFEQFKRESAEPLVGAELVERLARLYADFTCDHPKHFRLAMTWLLASPSTGLDQKISEEWSRRVHALLDHFQRAVERGLDDASIAVDAGSPQDLAFLLWGAVVGVLVTGFSDLTFPPVTALTTPREAAYRAISLLVAGLRA